LTDKPKAATDPHNIAVTFVNGLSGSGHAFGVANFTFETFRFTPKADGNVDIDPVISCRLRMDMAAVQQLRDACDVILQANLKPSNGTTH